MTNYCWAEFGTFKTILSNLSTSHDPALATDSLSMAFFVASSSATPPLLVFVTQCAQAIKVEKKKTIVVASAQKICKTAKGNGIAKYKKTPMSPPVLIELIGPGSKQRGRVTSITAKNTPSSCMRKIETCDERVDDKMND